MLTPQDIKNLTEYQKQVFVTKADFDKGLEKLEKSFSSLQTSVDSVVKEKDINHQERLVANLRIKDLENWADRVGAKVRVKIQR